MPITRRQFDLGINADLEEVMRRIHLQVAANKGEAFSSEELATAVGIEAAHLFDALEKLEMLGAIETRRVAGTTYYAFSAELPALH